MKKAFKLIVVLLITLVLLLVGILLFISPIAKYVIEKYDKEYVGREITIEKLNINLFKGRVEISNLKVYEKDSEIIFFEAQQTSTAISIKKLLNEEYLIEHFRVSNFNIRIRQRGSKFNFDDLLLLGQSSDSSKTAPKDTAIIKWFLNKIEAEKGNINYTDELVGSNIVLSKFNTSIDEISYDNNNLKVVTDFILNQSGIINAELKTNLKTLDYNLIGDIKQLNIHPLYAYLKELFYAKELKGYFNTNFIAKGNFNEATNIAVKGNINLNSFLVTDVLNDKLSSIKDLDITIDSINLKQNIFNINTVSLKSPYLKVEMYNNGTNFNRLMKIESTESVDSTKTTNQASSTNVFIILADYIQTIAKNYILNSYSADKIELVNGGIDYVDYTLGEKFALHLDSLNIKSSRINSENNRLIAKLITRINREGKLLVDISANPKDFVEMDFKTEVKKLPITIFNPYVKYYLANTFKKGDIDFLTNTSINASHNLNSENKLFIEKIKTGKKDKTITTAYNVPLKLGVALLRDHKGNIDFKFPITGNIDDPHYKLGKVVWTVFENLLLKAVISPFNAISGLFTEKDDVTEFEFNYLQTELTDKQQRKVLEKLLDMLTEKPELKIEFTQNLNPEKELEQLIYKEAKEKYYKTINNLTNEAPLKEDELKNIQQIENKDSLFVKFIDSKNSNLSVLVSHLEKCKLYVNQNNQLESIHDSIVSHRENYLKAFFKNKSINTDRLIFKRNIDALKNMNEVKPTFSFELDSED